LRLLLFVNMRMQSAMGNGQWAMGNGQWAMGNGQWAMGNEFGRRKVVLISEFASHSPLTIDH
jgi:hypothetical protein